MQNNQNVIETILLWLEQGECVWLSSITKTWGSSPMPAGTLMAYCSARGMSGSLSGGCIEQDLIEKMQTGELRSDKSADFFNVELIYGKSEADQKRFLLPCGGELHLLVEYLKPDGATIAHFSQLKQALAKRELIARHISLNDGKLTVISQGVQRGIKRQDNFVIHGMGPVYQMLLIGASEVARCVAELAQPLDFKVFVWDHREEFIRNWQVANVELFKGSPEKLISENFSDENNAIIALAHDPRVDDIALVDALATKAFYIGAIGSTKNCHNRNLRLLNYLDDPALLEKMHSPVGLKIGSKTPYEIAISILAEVIKKRAQLESERYII